MPAFNNYYQPASAPIFVKGIEGANNYPLNPNSSVALFDQDDSVFYIKSTDQSGFPLPLRVFDFQERVTKRSDDYITRKEFDELKQLIEDLTAPSKK